MPDDLDSFLQRAAQQRQRRKQAEIVILEPSAGDLVPTSPPPRTIAPPVRQAPPPRPSQPRPVVVIAEPVAPPRGEDVAQHVATHLDSRQFERRASHLGERVEQADDTMQAHLHQVFDHSVGSMGAPGQVVQSGDDAAAAQMSFEIMDTFRDADNLRRAIILNEILTPPSHRWNF